MKKTKQQIIDGLVHEVAELMRRARDVEMIAEVNAHLEKRLARRDEFISVVKGIAFPRRALLNKTTTDPEAIEALTKLSAENDMLRISASSDNAFIRDIVRHTMKMKPVLQSMEYLQTGAEANRDGHPFGS